MPVVSLRQRMNATGIGFAGIEGCWWLPAAEPFTLPAYLADDLAAMGVALFALFDAEGALYQTEQGQASGLDTLLEYRAPPHLIREICAGGVQSLRPDFQINPTGDPAHPYRLVATELEMCPSAQGFAHAMQVGYGLTPDLAPAFAHYLSGRDLLFAGAQRWSEFLFEQLAFCKALTAFGARGRVLYDRPFAAMAAEVQAGERWQPPMFGIRRKPDDWNEDVLGRIRAHGLDEFLWPDDEPWPDDVGDAVVFRFGYVDSFSPDHLRYFRRWQQRGAELLNPPTFWLDSKVVMAAANLPIVREHIAGLNPAALPILDSLLPETILLHPTTAGRLRAEKDAWLLKYAGFDGGDQAWGGRSLRVGVQHTDREWDDLLRLSLHLPWPVVAQRLTPSAQVDIGYYDASGRVQFLRQGATRLRVFFLRSADGAATACGAHVTVSGGTMQVSEGTEAVQAPVVFI